MIENIHPSIFFFVAALLVGFVPNKVRIVLQLSIPLLAFAALIRIIEAGDIHQFPFTLTVSYYGLWLIRPDKLALLFTLAFLFYTFCAHLYGLHERKRYIDIASNLYAGSSIGAVLAGDLITLFVFWEIMAVTSVFLIFNKARPGSVKTMLRYILVHLTGGLFFFAGLLIKLIGDGPMTFQHFELDTAGWLIFIGFAVNAAVVPLHAWLADAYPEGTPGASIYLCAFTTKVAVYAFARGFAGADILIGLGAVTAVYGVIYALMENDMRRLLSYHIICQVGYMLCGIGMGSHEGINAGTGHAIGNILFKGLLFMATGAIITAAGKSKLSELGGLSKKLPAVLIFYMIGGLAISGMPLLNGYITKSMLVSEAAHQHLGWLELLLLVVAVGTFMSICCKLAYFAFWAESSGPRMKTRVPLNMYLAMGGLSLACIAIGVFPDKLYRFLPYETHAHPYTASHVIHTLQLLLGTLVGFLIILPKLHTKDMLNLDLDWLYRRGAGIFVTFLCHPLRKGQEFVQGRWSAGIKEGNQWLNRKMGRQIMTPVGFPVLFMVYAAVFISFIMLIVKHG